MTNTMKSISVTLTEQQVAKVEQLLSTQKDMSFEQMLEACTNFGIANKIYRQERNKKLWSGKKADVAAVRDENAQLKEKLAALEAQVNELLK